MDKYYYMIAQLPMLTFDKASGMTIDGFLGEARKWLSGRDYQTLLHVKLGDTTLKKKGPQLLKQVRYFEYRFRSDLSRFRKALKTGQEFKPDAFPVSLLREGNPLEVEKKLLAWRWSFLEEQEKNHHFDLGFLVLYYLKLQILYRLSRFNKEKGLEIFHQIVAMTPDEVEGIKQGSDDEKTEVDDQNA